MSVKAQTQVPLALLDVVRTENSFADRAAESGTRAAFLAFAADSGLMLNGQLENAKESFEKRRPNNAFLNWRPSWADVAASGEIGYTTGSWAFSKSKTDEPGTWGEYFTIWKKQADGSWKFQLDLGIQHDKTEVPVTNSWKSPQGTAMGKLKVVSGDFWKTLETSFGEFLLKKGTKKTYERFASPQIHLLREGQLPFRGKQKAVAHVSDDEINFKPLGGEAISDFAYSYGEYGIKEKDGNIRKGFYARVWKKESSGWRITAEVANLLPLKN